MKLRILVGSLAVALLPLSAVGQTPATAGGTLGFYRFPDLHDDVIVFAAEGDLWRISVACGGAHSSHPPPGRENAHVASPAG